MFILLNQSHFPNKVAFSRVLSSKTRCFTCKTMSSIDPSLDGAGDEESDAYFLELCAAVSRSRKVIMEALKANFEKRTGTTLTASEVCNLLLMDPSEVVNCICGTRLQYRDKDLNWRAPMSCSNDTLSVKRQNEDIFDGSDGSDGNLISTENVVQDAEETLQNVTDSEELVSNASDDESEKTVSLDQKPKIFELAQVGDQPVELKLPEAGFVNASITAFDSPLKFVLSLHDNDDVLLNLKRDMREFANGNSHISLEEVACLLPVIAVGGGPNYHRAMIVTSPDPENLVDVLLLDEGEIVKSLPLDVIYRIPKYMMDIPPFAMQCSLDLQNPFGVQEWSSSELEKMTDTATQWKECFFFVPVLSDSQTNTYYLDLYRRDLGLETKSSLRRVLCQNNWAVPTGEKIPIIASNMPSYKTSPSVSNEEVSSRASESESHLSTARENTASDNFEEEYKLQEGERQEESRTGVKEEEQQAPVDAPSRRVAPPGSLRPRKTMLNLVDPNVEKPEPPQVKSEEPADPIIEELPRVVILPPKPAKKTFSFKKRSNDILNASFCSSYGKPP